jgi:precorrin-3B synthase
VLTAAALRAVADCADELGDGRVHLTSRGNLQLRGVSRAGALPARLAAAGLLPSTTHERVRNVLASPLSGIAGDPVARAVTAAGTTVGDPGTGSAGGDPAGRAVTAAGTTVGDPGTGSAGGDPTGRAVTAAGTTVDAREPRSWDVRGLAAALDRGLCARPVLAGLPGRFLFALDDGRGDVAAEDPDLCWRAPDTLLAAGTDTGLRVGADDAVAVLLDAAEAFLALRAADADVADHGGSGGGGSGGGGADGGGADGGAWRVAELVDGPARIGGALVARGRAGLRPGAGRAPLHALNASGGALLAPPRPRIASSRYPAAAVPGPVPRDDGGLALVVAPLLGELTAAQVRLLADAGPAVVVTPWRTIVLPDPRLPADVLAGAGLIVAPGPAADLSACAGRPGCAKSLADVRGDARAALGRMPSGGRLPTGRVHVSGCARRCGAPRAAHVDAVALPGGRYEIDGLPRPGLVL